MQSYSNGLSSRRFATVYDKFKLSRHEQFKFITSTGNVVWSTLSHCTPQNGEWKGNKTMTNQVMMMLREQCASTQVGKLNNLRNMSVVSSSWQRFNKALSQKQRIRETLAHFSED